MIDLKTRIKIWQQNKKAIKIIKKAIKDMSIEIIFASKRQIYTFKTKKGYSAYIEKWGCNYTAKLKTDTKKTFWYYKKARGLFYMCEKYYDKRISILRKKEEIERIDLFDNIMKKD